MACFSSSIVLPILLILLNSIYFACASSCAPMTPATVPTAPPSPKSLVTPLKCPSDALKLSMCAEMPNGLVNGVVGRPQHHCCTLLQGLAGFDAAVCHCTAIKSGVLGFNINVPVAFSMLINTCRKDDASGFNCTY